MTEQKLKLSIKREADLHQMSVKDLCDVIKESYPRAKQLFVSLGGDVNDGVALTIFVVKQISDNGLDFFTKEEPKTYEITMARYTKDAIAVRSLNGDGKTKTRVDRLVETLGGKYSHREKSYILPKSKQEKLIRWIESGYDANAVTNTLYPEYAEMEKEYLLKNKVVRENKKDTTIANETVVSIYPELNEFFDRLDVEFYQYAQDKNKRSLDAFMWFLQQKGYDFSEEQYQLDLYKKIVSYNDKKLLDTYTLSQAFDDESSYDLKLWDALPESKKVVPSIKPIGKFIVDPYEKKVWQLMKPFRGKFMYEEDKKCEGVNFDEYGACATNRHTLLFLKGEGGSTVYGHIDENVKKLNWEFVAYQTVTHNFQVLEKANGISCDMLLMYLKTIIDNNINQRHGATFAYLLFEGVTLLKYNATYLYNCVVAMKKLGNNSVNICSVKNYVSTNMLFLYPSGVDSNDIVRRNTNFVLVANITLDNEKKNIAIFDLQSQTVK